MRLVDLVVVVGVLSATSRMAHAQHCRHDCPPAQLDAHGCCRAPERHAAPPPSAAPERHPAHPQGITIASDPSGATVRLDGAERPLGRTPLHRAQLAPGAHTLLFARPGYGTARLDVTVERGDETFAATLAAAGSVQIDADVAGAPVFLDGVPAGTAPGRIRDVSPGTHIIELRPEGLSAYREMITVVSGAVASVNATLRPPAIASPSGGTLRVLVSTPRGTAPVDLVVTFDGEPVYGNPPTLRNAPAGTHLVQARATGFWMAGHDVQITAGQTTNVTLELTPMATGRR